LDLEIIIRTIAVIILGSESAGTGPKPKTETHFDEESAA
jgi:hypothetical protein